jgi:acyl-coenzyme A thioesterase PaaI-like protein
MNAIQDAYPGDTAVCYGCGKNNEHGHHIRSYWDGTIGTATFMPKEYHTAFPGFVYGGLLASLIDCHSMATASAAVYDRDGLDPTQVHEITHVTGNLNVNFLKPTPIDAELTLTATIKELTDRKAIVVCSVYANDVETVKAEVVAVRMQNRRFQK